jgi:hypothetical protein
MPYLTDQTSYDRKRLLAARANIEFWYPDKANTVMTLPFFENPKITESATASYVEYNPLARSSSLFVYTGAKSRRFRIEAKYTLPDLMGHPMGIARYKRIFSETDEASQRDLFLLGTRAFKLSDREPLSSIAAEARKFFFDNSDFSLAFRSAQIPDISSLPAQLEFENFLNNPEGDRAVDTMLFFVALLRSSILNNADNPVQGPPLARLNFGTLHESVPCIVKGYTLDWDDKAGYEVQTLTPRRLVISIDMQEVRVGNFGKYTRSAMIEKDNLAGWESVISSPHTIGPGQS